MWYKICGVQFHNANKMLCMEGGYFVDCKPQFCLSDAITIFNRRLFLPCPEIKKQILKQPSAVPVLLCDYSVIDRLNM